MKKTKTPGGKRKGAGRPKDEPKKAIGQRVPLRFHKHLVAIVKTELVKLLAQEASQGSAYGWSIGEGRD